MDMEDFDEVEMLDLKRIQSDSSDYETYELDEVGYCKPAKTTGGP